MVDQIDWTTTILEELFSSHPDRVRGAVLEGRGEEDKGVRSKERLKSWRIAGSAAWSARGLIYGRTPGTARLPSLVSRSCFFP